MSTPFQEAIRARDGRQAREVSARMTAQDCEDAITVLTQKGRYRSSQVRVYRQRLNWLKDQPDMGKQKQEGKT